MRAKVFSAQILGVLLLAVAVGLALTVIEVVAVDVQPLRFVTVILYVPDAKILALAILGFWSVEANPFTPVQAYAGGVPLPTPPPVRVMVFPAQMFGVLLLAVAVGLALTVTEVVAVDVQPLRFVTVIL